MEKKSDLHFHYPPNLQELDLATLVSLYRSRGEIRQAGAGQYLGCALTKKLVRKAKSWFGLTYSQEGWDLLLTRSSGGYPMTDVELNILGLAFYYRDQGALERSYVEEHCGTVPKLSFMIVNDLKQFGFLRETEEGYVKIAPAGVQALQGVCDRIYGHRFKEEMLIIHDTDTFQPTIEQAQKKDPAADQRSLF